MVAKEWTDNKTFRYDEMIFFGLDWEEIKTL